MPTITSSAVTDDEATFRPFPTGMLGVRSASLAVTAGQAQDADSVFQMIPVYAGETVYDVILQCTDMDSATALVLDVGDGLVTDRYIDGATIGQTGGTHRFANAPGAAPSLAEFPFRYTADDSIDIDVSATAGTGLAGTLKLTIIVG